MSIVNWDKYVDIPANLQISTEKSSPILGAGSLLLNHSSTNFFTHANLVPNTGSGYSHGITPAGRLRTICQVNAHDGSASQTSYFGLSIMNSQENLVTGGSCYALLVSSDEGLVNPTLRLHKFTSGLTDGLTSSSLIFIPFPGSITIGVPFTLEIEWVVDITNLNGTLLIARTGTDTNFTDLTGQMFIVDSISPLTTSVTEGVVASFKSSSISNTKTVLFDNTVLFELI